MIWRMEASITRPRVKSQTKLQSLKSELNRMLNFSLEILTNTRFSWIITSLLIIMEIFITTYVIYTIPYTEIDWKAYMEEVEGVLNGTLDYKYLKGSTGPLVYPAGFIYTFSILYAITNKGNNIFVAQHIFAIMYLATLFLIFRLYKRSKIVPPYALIFMCCTSYRIHSIYVLRLFNDPIAIFFLFLAINCFSDQKWYFGCILFSFAVSIKMNIMLFAPGLFFILLCSLHLYETLLCIALCALVQVIVGFPFLIANPISYLSSAFDFGRIFMYQWTVNWRFLPEAIFVHRSFHITLLISHLIFLIIFALHWKRNNGFEMFNSSKENILSHDNLLYILFTSNFIGIVFSRSLHYQFYVWYFFTLPYLLWSTKYNSLFKLCILGILEMSWNTYPSTVLSSGLLHASHLLILGGLLYSNMNISLKDMSKIK